MYNSSSNTNYHNPNSRTNANNSKPRYREVPGQNRGSGGGRGRDSQKKQNVWARRTPQTPTPETDYLSRFGIGEQPTNTNTSPSAVIEEAEALAQQLSATSLQNGETQEQSTNPNEIQKEKKLKVPKDPNSKKPIEKITSKTTKLSLAEFYSSVHTNQDEGEEIPSRVLWVGNIGPEVSEEELSQEFGQFGKIESLRILHNRFCAFVNFEEEEAAKEAKKQLHGTIVGSQYIVIHYRPLDQSKPTTSDTNFVLNSPSRALWIGNISDQVTEDELCAEFEQFGKIESIRVLRNKTCAFVNFTNVEEASNALQALQGKKLGNMAIKINFGKPYSLPPKEMSQYLSPQGGYLGEYSYGIPNNLPSNMPLSGMMIPPQYLSMMEPYQFYDQAIYEQMYEQMNMYMPNPGSYLPYGYVPAYPPNVNVIYGEPYVAPSTGSTTNPTPGYEVMQ